MNGPWFLERFERVKPDGDGRWRARCPVCGSDRQNLLREGDDRYTLTAYCKCDRKSVLEAVGLRFGDLFFVSTAQRGSFEVRPLRGGCTPPGTSVDRRPLSHGNEVDELVRAYKAGEIPEDELVRLDLCPPRNATAPMRRVLKFFGDVHALRVWADIRDETGAPVADDVLFDTYWVSRHLGIPQKTVWRALQGLVEAKVLNVTGQLHGRNGRRGPRTFGAAKVPKSNVVLLEDRRAA